MENSLTKYFGSYKPLTWYEKIICFFKRNRKEVEEQRLQEAKERATVMFNNAYKEENHLMKRIKRTKRWE